MNIPITERTPQLVYNEWVNDFLTIKGMADYYGIYAPTLGDIIREGKRLTYVEIFKEAFAAGDHVKANCYHKELKKMGMKILDIVKLQGEAIDEKKKTAADTHKKAFMESLFLEEDMCSGDY